MTGSLTNWLALKSTSVGRSQHLVSSRIKSWRTREGISVSSVPKCLIPAKPLPGFRIPALWQVTSSTFQSDDILYEWRRLAEAQVSEFKEYTFTSDSWEPTFLTSLFRTYGHLDYEILLTYWTSLILKLLQLSSILTRMTGLMYISWDGELLLLAYSWSIHLLRQLCERRRTGQYSVRPREVDILIKWHWALFWW